MSVGQKGIHRKTKNHKALRSKKNRDTKKYEKQRTRTEKNKTKRK